MNEIDHLVFLTIAYSSHFSFALNKEEITQRLPSNANLQYLFNQKINNYKKILISQKKINNSLKKLLKLSLIKTNGEYFYLQEQDLLNRKQKMTFHAKKIKEAQIFANLAKKIPFVKAVVLTGSTAVGNATKDDDLDFMIICKKNTLWLTRFLLIILIKFKNKRPQPYKANAWCMNLLLDENDLVLDQNRRSLYEAYEILQMNFLFDRDKYSELFLNANQWLRKYLIYYENYQFNKYKKQNSFSILNHLFFYLQKYYRLIIFGKENFTINLTQAFYNDINFKNNLLIKLERKINFKK